MAPLWITKKAPIKGANSEAFNNKQLIRQYARAPEILSKISHDWEEHCGLRVLVVDHDQEANDKLIRLSRRWGYTARMAHDGLAALRVAAVQHPDVVLLNMELPLVDGCQVTRQLRQDFSRANCFIIAFTNFPEGERHQQYIEAGVDLLLIKPVDPSVVETLLLMESARVAVLPTAK